MSWFDQLLEELQRRQEQQDAQREGRPPPEPDELSDRRRRGGRGRPPPVASDWGLGQYRRYLIIGLIAVAVLIVLGFLGGVINLIADLLWFEAVGFRDVLTTRLFAQIGLFAFGFALFALLALGSILAARRLAPRVPVRRLGGIQLPDASRAITLGVAAVALVFALGSAAAWSANWETVLLFVNGGPFAQSDPHFGRDIGFYVFDLPFWRFVQGYAVTTLIVIIGLSMAVYAAGAMTWQFRLTAPVRVHLSILGALLLVAIAAGYQLDVFDLAYSVRGTGGAAVAAVTHTDYNAQQPAYMILTVVALAAAAVLLANIWFRTLWLLAIAVVAWLGISILVGGLYPAFVQRVSVEPNELAVERPFLVDHIGATRTAMELDTIDLRRFTGEEPLSRELFEQEESTLNNLRLWDYRPLLSTFGQQQILRQYYTFVDVDIDRYQIDGELRQLMLSAREITGPPAEGQTWTNERLVYTHGFGLTAVPVNAVTSEGQPGYLVSGIGREDRLDVEEPRIYFGEVESADYVVVGTDTREFDYPLQDGEAFTTWQGDTGVRIGNPLSRALFALRFGDVNLLISGQLTEQSQILFRRTIQERVPAVAPFLVFDADPYLVAAEGQLYWLWDAYTVTDRFPNAQPLRDTFTGANYVRNAVKVAVDAYDGSMRFFVVEPDDPIVNAYWRIFPNLFEPMDAMPEGLRAHIRYPEGLFRAQAESYLLYHVQANERGANTLYNREDVWQVPMALDADARTTSPMEPYYVIMRLPGEEDAEFVLIQPLVAANRPNMIAWIAARNDGDNYGERIAFNFPSDTTIHGPQQVEARIDQDPTISAQITLWDRAGSRVIRGNLLVLPMGDSVLYVEPVFLQSEQARFPEFVRIILASQTRVAFAETLDEALRQILGEAPLPPPVEEPPTEPGETPEPGEPTPPPVEEPPTELPDDVAALVVEAQRVYDQAQAALQRGDLGEYQRRIDELGEILDRIAELTGE